MDVAALVVSIVALTGNLALLWWQRRVYLNTRRRNARAMGVDDPFTLRDEIRDVFLVEEIRDWFARRRDNVSRR